MKKKKFCLITYIDFYVSNPLWGLFFSGKQELSKLDYYF